MPHKNNETTEESELQAWFLHMQDAIALSQTKFLQSALMELAHKFLYGRKVSVALDDWGYDCSERPMQTNHPYRAEDYDTVADFLHEATGQTVATFVSGAGLAAETFEEQVYEELNSQFFELLKTMATERLGLATADDLPFAAEDIVAEMALEWTWQTLERLQAVSLSWMLKAYREQAQQQQAQIESVRVKTAEQQRQAEETARRIHRQGHFLLTRLKYNMAEQEELIAALEQLSEIVSGEELGTYLRSSCFKALCSNNLWQKVCAQFIPTSDQSF